MKQTALSRIPQVAVLLETSHGISRAMLNGILSYVRVYGPWSLNLASGGTSDLRVPNLRQWQGSGILGRVTTAAVARDILASKLPAVLFNPSDAYLAPSHPLSRYGRTHCDSHAVGTLAAEYYLGKAFARLAFVGETSGANWSRWRLEAFAARLKTAGLPCHVYPLPPKCAAEWSAERPRLCAWLKSLPKPVGIFAANDNRARQVLDACLVAEIAVPYEAAVLGVNNDVLICETCIPALSSVAVDAERAGYEAARLLDELMRSSSKRQRVLTYGPTGVISRASTEALHVTDPLVIRALDFIRLNGGLNIRVTDVAAQLGVTPRWAEMRFRQALGTSIHGAIDKARTDTVCKMLRETAQPIQAISKACGFARPNHLCTAFKKQFGLTMGAYREKLRI